MTRLVPDALAIALFLSFAVSWPAHAAATNAAPAFSEVYELVRTHLRGLSAAELERAAVEGLLATLGPRVVLVTGDAPKPADAALVSQARVLEQNVAYLRVGAVAEGLARAVADAHAKLSRTSKVVGVVLDLRFAGGDNYAAAAEVAGLFLGSQMALLDWGGGAVKVQPAENRISLPVAVLMNRDTSGAAEALAAALREAGAGLLLGARTAGAAAMKREFTLTTGQKLLLATAPVKLANGTALAPHGVKPDIEVTVGKDDEKAYFAAPYRELPKAAELASESEASATNQVAGTNRVPRRPRPTEADLVRARREGVPLDAETVTARESEPQRPVLRDPALARAVDLLKGLAVVRPGRS